MMSELVNVITLAPDELTESNYSRENRCTVEGCDVKLSNSSALRLHIAKCHRIGTIEKRSHKVLFACPIIGCSRAASSKRYFSNKNSLKRHYQSIHGVKKYECCKCKKKFGYYWIYRSHEDTCGELFYCQCGCYYSTLNALKHHCKMKTHEMEKNYDFEKKTKENIRKLSSSEAAITLPAYLLLPSNCINNSKNTLKDFTKNISVVNIKTANKKKQKDGLYEILPKPETNQSVSTFQLQGKTWQSVKVNLSGVTNKSVKYLRHTKCDKNKKTSEKSYHYEDLNLSSKEFAKTCKEVLLTFKDVNSHTAPKLNKLTKLNSAKTKLKLRKAKERKSLSEASQCTNIPSPVGMADSEAQTDVNSLFSWLHQLEGGNSNIETQTMPINDLLDGKQWNYDLMDSGTQTNSSINTRFDDSSTQTTNLINQLLSADSSNIATQTNSLNLFDASGQDPDNMFDVHFNINRDNIENFIDSATQTFQHDIGQFDTEMLSINSATQTQLQDFEEIIDKLNFDNSFFDSGFDSLDNNCQNISMSKNSTSSLSTQTLSSNSDFLLENLRESVKTDLLFLDSLLHLPNESNDFGTQTFKERASSSSTQTFDTGESNEKTSNIQQDMQQNMETQTAFDNLYSTDSSALNDALVKETCSTQTQTLFSAEEFGIF